MTTTNELRSVFRKLLDGGKAESEKEVNFLREIAGLFDRPYWNRNTCPNCQMKKTLRLIEGKANADK